MNEIIHADSITIAKKCMGDVLLSRIIKPQFF